MSVLKLKNVYTYPIVSMLSIGADYFEKTLMLKHRFIRKN